MFTRNNIVVILELHWSSEKNVANKQEPMPNLKNSVPFWREVSNLFKYNLNIFFDVFNEPYPFNNAWDSEMAWKCNLHGGNYCTDLNYTAAGMQILVDTIRSTGAKNIIMIPGISYSNSMLRWLEYIPKDPLNNIVASWHVYNFNLCFFQLCWEKYLIPIIEKYPLVVGELGENLCESNFIVPLMKWLDLRNVTYLAWTFNTWDCRNGPALIADWNGNPTNYGKGFKIHLNSTN